MVRTYESTAAEDKTSCSTYHHVRKYKYHLLFILILKRCLHLRTDWQTFNIYVELHVREPAMAVQQRFNVREHRQAQTQG